MNTACHFHWKLLQYNVKNAFLLGDLEEEIYMNISLGFEEDKNKVCRLREALYGLKQFLGYNQSQGDHILLLNI